MRRLIFLFGLFTVLGINNIYAQETKNEQTTVCFKTNMTCHNCELTLTNYLKFEKGVKDLKFDLQSNTIKVVYKSGKNSPENLAKGIKKQGYEANMIPEKEYNHLIQESSKK
ncbi:MAG: heavy-metal-associated domain-containing protein [Prolixibacteraceae bacterium]|nr:heavy-metal-associated domain-containing protein [Prolixibacteraceae bacterium]